jgi:eukaryotic-like serine/threonine-protein kinase
MMPRQGTVVADRYRLERKVGGGRVSAMWLVQDQVTEGPCAIKLLHRSMNDHPEALARFSLEDRLSRELSGSYFPERIGSGSWHSLRYIAWRWYEGECLRSLFERTPKQDVQTVYSIVQETCQALTAVHGAGYTHGDLKPENLFFAEHEEKQNEPARQLKLLGFGVASRLARPLLGSQARRTPGQIVGTPLYLSPDLILGRVPRGGTADLWALAVIVYEALTGRAPFLGTDLAELLQVILERQAPRPSSVTDNLPGTFDLWWSQALDQQFATPGEFSSSLARALAPALRSSRTQRSASLPDRTAPVAEAFARRPNGNGGAAEAPAFRPGSPTPAGGLTSPGMGPPRDLTPVVATVVPKVAATSAAADKPAASNEPAASKKAASKQSAAATAAAAALPASQAAALQKPTPQPNAPAAAAVPAKPAATEDDARTPIASKAGAEAGTQRPAARTEPSVSVATPITGSPVTSSPVTGSPVTGSPVTSSPVTSSPVTSSPVTSSPATGSPAAGKPAANSPAASTAPEPAPRNPVTSNTVAGIGPAALSMVRALETAAAGTTAKIRVMPPGPGAASESGDTAKERGDTAKERGDTAKERGDTAKERLSLSDTFAPLPSPLRDLGVGTRKTLVGIIPPVPAAASATPPATPPASPPAAVTPAPSLAIAGTPCRTIEVSDDPVHDLHVLANQRRLGSPTVPFPRPRAASRAAAPDFADATPERGTALPPNWQQRTSNTLRVVLTDPDHRPHLVAGLLVCAAAALVIFAFGRSPVAGTGALVERTRALNTAEGGSARPAPPPGSTARAPERPAPRDRAAALGGAASPEAAKPEAIDPKQEEARNAATPDDAKGSNLPGRELAPGLVVPPAPASGAPRATAAEKPRPASPSPLPPTRMEPGPAPAAGDPLRRDPALAAPPPRATPKKPGEAAPAPRPAGGDFDFGI